MTTFLALYRGRTVSDAELVALSAEPGVVSKFFEELTREEIVDASEDPRDEAPVIEFPHPVRGDE